MQSVEILINGDNNWQGLSNTDVTKFLNELCMLVEEEANVVTVKRNDFDKP